MESSPTLSLRELRQVLDRLLGTLEEQHGRDEVEVTADHYWALDPGDTYKLGQVPDPARLMVGQLSDDLAELRVMATSGDPPVIWHDLSHVLGILQWLAARDRP